MVDRVRVRAPQLTGAGGWIGDGPADLAQLRGRVVLLDFWTLGCINCLRVLEELRGLERRFGDDLVVLGVHSPKFPHEHRHEAVVAAVVRHRIGHPVLDDPARVTWDAYGARAWPTLVLVDPEGRVALTVSGEGHDVQLAAAIEHLLARRGPSPSSHGGLGGPSPQSTFPATTAFPGVRGSGGGGLGGRSPQSPELAFPGKVAVGDGRLAIADTGHDRVLEVAADGEVLAEHEGLYLPQGVRYEPDGALLVCEAGADAVWRLARGRRELITDACASPWDVVRWQGHVVIAEAGRHRLVGVDAVGEAQAIAGRAPHENLLDGPADRALLAQPSGLAVTPAGDLAFVDSESSALRVLRATTLEVETLAGHGLFTSGCADGDREHARLQHPLGVAAAPDGALYVADTYNGALRVLRGAHLWTVPVEGFAEPGGLDVLPDGRLVVADTANHRIVLVDPLADPAVAIALDVGRTVAEPVVLAEGEPLPLAAVAHGTLDTGAPVRVLVRSPLLDAPADLRLADVPDAVELALRPGAGRVEVELELATCTPDACRLEHVRRDVDVIVQGASDA